MRLTYEEVSEKLARAQSQLSKLKGKGEALTGEILSSGVSATTAFMLAYFDASTVPHNATEEELEAHWSLIGIPYDLLGAAGLKIASAAGIAGRYDPLMAAAGTGALDCFATKQGLEIGLAAAEKKAKAAATASTSGRARIAGRSAVSPISAARARNREVAGMPRAA